MATVRGKNTKPEVLVRSLIHRLGYRFRLHYRNLPGSPDIVFPSRKKVIWVHGCFWHLHRNCRIAHIPKAHRAYWKAKLERNRERDAINKRKLRRLGWDYLVLWECGAGDLENLGNKIINFLEIPHHTM